MKVLIAGMGLIGGSFALALRDRGIADEILGTDSSEENAAEALRLGLAAVSYTQVTLPTIHTVMTSGGA